MSGKKIRIGIDVGGTFTHAVALEHQTYEVIAHAVTPTTHTSKLSVSEGIIQTFKDVLSQTGAAAGDVIFVAHSTTQATNALLEGDVAKVGIIGMGHGMEGIKAKSDTAIKDIKLSDNKFLYTEVFYYNSDGADFTVDNIQKTIGELQEKGCSVVVASEAFGVDDAKNEIMVTETASSMGIPSTASHEISQLYGLKVRTRTAVINASILPKMTQTARMTDESIRKSGISAPLMIMRSDGGVMDISQMRKRPILTLLSGPAAGIAAALMYANVSDGIFLEVGGTSTDVSAIKNGKAMIKSADVGGHSTFLKTLDSRTVGIGGGSMVRVKSDGKVVDVGPRSAHIAGFTYLAFAEASELDGAKPLWLQPMPSDPEDYLVMQNPAGKNFAVTLTDAAMMAGVVKPSDYAYGNLENVQACFAIVGEVMGVNPIEFAESILNKAAARVNLVVQKLLEEYALDPELVSLVGGGGGCTTVVPWLSKTIGIQYLIADKAEVISAIGAAMAMLRDVVAKTVVNPSKSDIAAIRRQAIDSLMDMGADPDSVEVQMEIDNQKNTVTATATGSIQMENQEFGRRIADDKLLLQKAASSFKVSENNVALVCASDGLKVYCTNRTEKKLFGLLKTKRQDYRVLDKYGVVKLQLHDGSLQATTAGRAAKEIEEYLQSVSTYNDAGQVLPEVFLLHGNRVVDFTSVIEHKQVMALISVELEGARADMPVIVLIHNR